MEVTAIRLATEEDWQANKERFESLEEACPLSPYLNWAYTHECWEAFTPDTPNWMIFISEPDGRPVAGTIWREFIHKGRPLGKNAIRTFDHIFFMRVPPLLVQPGDEARAYEALVGANTYLKKTIKADMVTLYRLDQPTVKPLVSALESAGVTHKFEYFTEAPWLVMGDDFDEWILANHRKAAKATPRKLRRLEEMYGGEPVIERIQTHQLSDEDYEACFARYQEIFQGSWQFEWQEKSEEVDNELTNRFTKQAFDIWRSKYVLTLYFLKAGPTCLAYIVALEYEGVVDNLLMGYTQECRKYSPGEISFMFFIQHCHQRGIRSIDLGGELLEWKQRWSNHIDQSIHLEWPLGGLAGKVWSLARRLKKD